MKKFILTGSVFFAYFVSFVCSIHAGDATLTLDDNTGSSSFVVQDSDKTTQFKVNSDGQGYFTGNVGIGTTGPAAKLQVIGAVRAGTANDGLEIGNFVSTDAGIRNFGSGSHLLIDSDNTRFRSKDGATSYIEIKSTGKVGIGTTNPTQLSTEAKTLLNVHSSTSRAEITISAAGMDGVTDLSMGRDSTYSMLMRFDGQTGSNPGLLEFYHTSPSGVQKRVSFYNSNVGIGTENPTEKLEVSGNIKASGTVSQGSSKEFKKNISYVSTKDAMSALNKLNPVRFEYKTDESGEKHLGFIAEDVPDLVAEEDRKHLNSMDITAVLAKVVQEQQRMLLEQKEVMDAMKQEIQMLKSAMNNGAKGL